MAYSIDPIADWPLVEEFRRAPIGHHSPNLMRLLNLLRVASPGAPRSVLVVHEPLKSWVLGQLWPNRTEPVTLVDTVVYTSREDAEWAVFCARWQARTGIAINSPRHQPLPRELPC